MLKAVYIMNPKEAVRIYRPEVQAEIARKVRVLAPVLSPDEALRRPELLRQMDILFSGWGGPILDREFLETAPNLKALFYGAGAVGYMTTEEFWRRQILVTTANTMNAVPVAEFSVALIVLGLKRAWQQALEAKKRRAFFHPQLPVSGAYRSTVGLIALGTIGRLVRQKLSAFDVKVLAYDPTIDPETARALDVEMVSLAELFVRSDVVSLHAPQIAETIGLVTGAHLACMKSGATFINTARGAIVREKEMIDVLRARPDDLTAVLDVTDPEPPSASCALFDLPNVFLTPHIAGSLDGECMRMGQWMLEELKRYLAGKPLLTPVEPPKDLSISEPATDLPQAAGVC
jgi:phosphoglycerate dehydrogenase-like enzyme